VIPIQPGRAGTRAAPVLSGALLLIATELELARIVALADNGHTQAFPEPRAEHYNRVPIRLNPFGGQFHVVRARADYADLLGAKLVAIDGTDLPALRAAAHSNSHRTTWSWTCA
jgi:hypothetical protein